MLSCTRVAALAALVVLVVVSSGCGGSSTATPATTTGTPTGTTPTTTTTAAPGTTTGTPTGTTPTTTTTTAAPRPTTVRIAVVGGVPRGGIVRATVHQGDHVVLVVTSDVADEVHLHGYDLKTEVAAGGTARLPFRATIPGRFEVELESRSTQIADLTVEP